MDNSAIEAELLEYFKKQLLFKKKDLKPKDILLTNGSLDSVAHLKLISYLEKKYSIDIAIEDFDPENFDSVEKIARFIQKKKKQSSR